MFLRQEIEEKDAVEMVAACKAQAEELLRLVEKHRDDPETHNSMSLSGSGNGKWLSDKQKFHINCFVF